MTHMARKNRISVPDGTYHITTRIAHGAMLLKDDSVKERIVKALYSVADFSGVEIYAWNIMDNHIHILAHVPEVPKRFRIDPDVEPPSYAFGMRPAECRVPLWTKDEDDIPTGFFPRPPLEFKLDDDELFRRLGCLYNPDVADKIFERWERAIEAGLEHIVEEQKTRLFRRMYNVSQFMKTFKERVTRYFNVDLEHKGALWQGRFYSGLVEDTSRVLSIVAAYIDYNPVKARLVNRPTDWKWGSFSVACTDSKLGEYCRRQYEKILDCKWPEAKARMEAIFADKLPDDLTEEEVRRICDYYDDAAERNEYYREHPDEMYDEEGAPWRKKHIRASQAIHVTSKIFKGAFIGSVEFALRTMMRLPKRYPMHKTASALRCSALDWRGPMVA